MVDNQKRKRIGFVSYWGFGRGQANVTRMYVKMLKDNYDIFILKQFDNPIEDEFKFDDVKITEHSEYSISHPFFKKWITDNKLDAVVFNEYNQWSSGVNDLIPIAHELGVKVYGYLVWEKYRNNEDYEPYDRIWCPTKSFCRFMRTHRFRKFTYIPYSVDLDEYPIVEKSRDKDKFVFFHPGGWGGVHNRKNTENVLKAFNKLQQNKDNCKLIITSQRKIEINNLPDNVELVNKNLTRDELIKYYQNCDCMVMPSKWDTVGISIEEAMAFGKPVITTDSPPMNEFITSGTTGYLCTPEFEDYDDISVMAACVDETEIFKQMNNSMAVPELTTLMGKNARKIIENKYDLDKNKHLLIDFLEAELNGRE